jgi:enamine deaminase RidA (YjgF/YER057c/UK114 family)
VSTPVPGKLVFGEAPPMPIHLAVRAGDFVFTSAVGDHGFSPPAVTFDDSGRVLEDGSSLGHRGIEAQTRDTLVRLQSILAMAGCTLEDVVESTVWLRDPRDFIAFNEVYREFFPTNQPVRSVIRADFMFNVRIEIKVVAYKPLAR